jgi:hypothetical protein
LREFVHTLEIFTLYLIPRSTSLERKCDSLCLGQ